MILTISAEVDELTNEPYVILEGMETEEQAYELAEKIKNLLEEWK